MKTLLEKRDELASDIKTMKKAVHMHSFFLFSKMKSRLRRLK